MPYKVLAPEVQILEKIGEIRDGKGEFVSYEHRAATYFQDELVPDDKISPILVEAYDDGEEHIQSLIERVEEVTETVEKPKRRTSKAATSVDSDDSDE